MRDPYVFFMSEWAVAVEVLTDFIPREKTTHPRACGCAHQAPKKSRANLDIAASASHGDDTRMCHGRQTAYSALTGASKVETIFLESIFSQRPNGRYSPIDPAQGAVDLVPAGTSVLCVHQHASGAGFEQTCKTCGTRKAPPFVATVVVPVE